MIDPFNVINFQRDGSELEEFLLFSICVAGKKATRVASAVDQLICKRHRLERPLHYLARLDKAGSLEIALRAVGVGQYTRIGTAIRELIARRLDLSKCTVADLESIHGIGPKTARMFVMFTRPNQRHAIIDTHILKFLRANGVSQAPANTPSSKSQYLKLEHEFLRICDQRKVNPAEFDLAVWSQYAQAA